MPKHTFNAYFYAVIVAFGGFIFGLDAAVISGTVKYIEKLFDLDALQVGTAVSAPGLGAVVALLFTGWICNKIGRKKTLIIVAVMYLISAVCSAYAPSYVGLVCARFLGGLAFCSLSLASMYIGEIAPAKLRGKMVSMNQMNIVVGLLAAFFVNYAIKQFADSGSELAVSLNMQQEAWRYMLGSEIIPALFWLVAIFLIPESPRWLVLQGRFNDAEKVLEKVLPQEEIATQIEEMRESLQHSQEQKNLFTQLAELMSPRMRIAFLIGLIISIVQPTTGINAILFYAPTVFEQLGGGGDVAFTQAVYVGIVSVVFTALALVFIDKLGRRPMMVWGLLWVTISLAICAWGFNDAYYELTEVSVKALPVEIDVAKLEPIVNRAFGSDIEFKTALKSALGDDVVRDHSSILIKQAAHIQTGLILFGILSFIAAFHFSVGPVLWVLYSEIFPTSLRGVAIPLFALVNSICSYLVQKFFPWQLETMGSALTFLMYGGVAFGGFLLLFKILPETKNKTIEEIELELEAVEEPELELEVV